jgi:phosphoglycerate dehydrogenase-like enzyme
MAGIPTLFVTERVPIHQQLALEAAPDGLEIEMLASPGRDEVLAALGDAEIFVSERSGAVDEAHVEAGPKLRLIQRLGSQVHDIDLEAARRAGVPVCYWPLPQSRMVAEHVLMQMLALVKRAREASEVVIEAVPWGEGPQRTDANTFKMNWSGRRDIRQIHASTVGILGFGEIGTELALRLRPLGCRVLYSRLDRLPESTERRLGVDYAATDDLLPECDIVVSLLPHSPETEGVVAAEFIARMRPGAMLVGSGASTNFDEEAVAAAYRSGHLGGVATDGHRWEPVRPDDPLVVLAADRSANVVLTPHTALGDMEQSAAARAHEFTNLVNLIEGRPLQHRLV